MFFQKTLFLDKELFFLYVHSHFPVANIEQVQLYISNFSMKSKMIRVKKLLRNTEEQLLPTVKNLGNFVDYKIICMKNKHLILSFEHLEW